MSNNMVMAFSPRNIVGCFLKKRLTKGGGITGTSGPPLATPLTGQFHCTLLLWTLAITDIK